MKSEERRVKNPCAKVMLASIINKTNVPADLRSAGIKYKDFFNPLKNTIIRTYSPKGYTSVTVGDTPTACARQTMSTRSGAILEQITDIIANKEVT